MRRQHIWNISAIITAIFLLIALQPYFIWHLPPTLKLFVLASPSILLVRKLDIRKYNKSFVLFFSLLLLNNIIQGFSIIYSIYLLLFSIIPFVKRDYALVVFKYFKTILALVFSFSLFEWMLYLMGVQLPGFYIEPLTEMKTYDYTVYIPFLVVPNLLLDSFRFLSVFDEPGVVGTISLLVLFVESYKFNDWRNVIIFIAGISSFSFFFILGSLLYMTIVFLSKKPYVIFAFILVLFIFYNCTKDNEVLDKLVYSRLEWDSSSGTFAGDNRATDNFKSYYDSIKGTSGYYWGVGQKALDNHNDGGYGYRNVILRYGAVFCFLYVIFFICFAYTQRLSLLNNILFCLMLLATLYQRPNMLDASYIFLFTQFINNHTLKKMKMPEDI